MLFIVMLALHFLIIKLWNFQYSEVLVESKFYYPMWIKINLVSFPEVESIDLDFAVKQFQKKLRG